MDRDAAHTRIPFPSTDTTSIFLERDTRTQVERYVYICLRARLNSDAHVKLREWFETSAVLYAGSKRPNQHADIDSPGGA
jgi:hypothetical protein